MGWVRGLLNTSGMGAEEKRWRTGLHSAKSQGEPEEGTMTAAQQLCYSRRPQHCGITAWLQLVSSSPEEKLRGEGTA